VAIIGILAAIAVPSYQSYVAKAQASEAYSLLDGIKTPVQLGVGESGLTGGCIVPAGATSNGKYGSIGLAVSGSTCVATYTFSSGKNSGQTVIYTYTPAAAGTNPWQCSIGGTPAAGSDTLVCTN